MPEKQRQARPASHTFRHYECWNETGEAMTHLAMIHLMLRRLTMPGVGIT
jgi:hypothetical protein